MRILRVIPTLDVGGVQRQMLLAFRGLARLGHECEVCCIDERGEFADAFEKDGFRVHRIRFFARLCPVGLPRLRMLGMRGRFDIVHGHMYAANMAVDHAFLGTRGRPALVNGYHNQIVTANPKQAARIAATRHRPAAFVAVGESVADALVDLQIPRDRIAVVRNGVVGPENPPPLPERRDGDPLHLIWMGRFVTQKRADFLVEVAAACRDRGVPVRMTLLGDGPKFKATRRLIDERGVGDIVETPGVSRDVFGHLAKADVYVSASWREGFPNALLEACAARRPFIVSDIDPHKEVLGARDAGRLLPAEAPAWADAIAELGRDRARLARMADESLAIGRECSMDEACRRTVELYERIAARSA